MKLLDLANVTLAVEGFGDRSDPPVVLIAGATQSMDWWTPDFCALLAAQRLFVIRYDQRDTGESTTSPPGRPTYSGVDLATDPVRILDALGIAAAHLVGLSMGGGIAQYLGVTAAHRVLTLTLIESSPAGGEPGEVPPSTEAVSAAGGEPAPLGDWADAAAVIDYRVESERPYAGSLGFDEQRVRAIATAEVARTRNMESSWTNHFLVAQGAEADPARITAPTLVLHSATDPLFPLPHGEALARMIPGATLRQVEGMGHEAPPPQVWSAIVPALAGHMRGDFPGTERAHG